MFQDNQRLIRIPVAVETDWRVTGTSKPSQVEYNITQEIPDKYKFEEELGEEVTHVYAINNPGPSTIQGRNSIDTLNLGHKTGHETGPHSGPNSVLGHVSILRT